MSQDPRTVAPVVSVVIPAYNAERYLPATIASVRAQTLERWELFVVDDGSSDDTAKLVELLAREDARVHLVRHEGGANRGQFASRVEGARRAKSTLVALLDADDLWEPRYLETSVRAFEAVRANHPDLALLYSAGRYFYEDHSQPDFVQPVPPRAPRTFGPGAALPAFFADNYISTPCPSAALIRRDVLLQARALEDAARGNIYEDQFLWLSTAAKYPVHVTSFTLMNYRQRGDSFSRADDSKQSRSRRDERSMLETVCRNLREDPSVSERTVSTIERLGRARKYMATVRDAVSSRTPTTLKLGLKRARARLTTLFAHRDLSARAHVHEGTAPLSTVWGADRGTPIHRRYLDGWLRQHRADVRGNVLEFQNDEYASKLGRAAISSLDILHVDDTNPAATVVADLTRPNRLAANSYDCIICTHVLQLVEDYPAAIADMHRILKPGGVLLVAVPQTSMFEEHYQEYWRFTKLGLRAALGKHFANEQIAISTFGNSLVAAAELRGLVAEEFSEAEISTHDERFALEVCARAVKSRA